MKKMILLFALLLTQQSFALGGIGSLGSGNLEGFKLVKKVTQKKEKKHRDSKESKKRRIASKERRQNIWNLESDSEGFWN